MALMQSKDNELRLYDGSTPARYAVARFLQDGMSVPGMGPRPDETTYLDRGIANAYMARVAADDTVIYNGIPWTVTFLLNEEFIDFITMLSNPDGVSPWQVFGQTLTPVTNIGSRINGRGVAVACPLPADAVRQSFLVNAYWKFDSPPGVSPANPMVRQALGVAATSLTYTVNAPIITVSMECMIYGAVGRAADFPSGSELSPYT